MIFFKFIIEVFIQVIIEGVIGNFFKVFFSLFRKLGVLILKVITVNRTSFKKLDEEYYKDSVKQHLVTFVTIIGIVYLAQFGVGLLEEIGMKFQK